MTIKKERMFNYDKRVKIYKESIKHFQKNDELRFLHNQEKTFTIREITTIIINKGIFGLQSTINYYDLGSGFNHTVFTLFRTLIELKRNKKIIKFYS